MKKLIFIPCITILGIVLLIGCASAIRYDGPYEGRVIDADTGQSIEEVVVLGVWSREHISPGGATHTFYDAKETVTDKNGEFRIEGMGLEILKNVTSMDVLIFKTGYEHLGYGPWESLKISKYLIEKRKIKWEGKKAIIPLNKLTMEERKKKGPPSRPSIPIKKMTLLTKEINKERIAIGLTPFELEGNEK
jgi:hypothetical protein